MLLRLPAYTLLVAGFLIVLFFRNYRGSLIAYPFLYWFFGLAISWIGYLLLRKSRSLRGQAEQKQLLLSIETLKAHGESIRVDLKGCEVRQNNYRLDRQNEEIKEDYLFTGSFEEKIQLLHALSSDSIQSGSIEVQQSIIVFSYPNARTGKTETFISRTLPKDKVSLTVCLLEQQYTYLYVDKSDRKRYYFDLSFL